MIQTDGPGDNIGPWFTLEAWDTFASETAFDTGLGLVPSDGKTPGMSLSLKGRCLLTHQSETFLVYITSEKTDFYSPRLVETDDGKEKPKKSVFKKFFWK
ncbi:unnamed protein product [Ranitomeya imitator]|uniref:Uncharacterized protein n=1 Tax=Ranitomeya imitator TaxID=111125 RepID=A0ABN9L614_9NEOB|nr:unnamed protein product [Ranitomeya imitator]